MLIPDTKNGESHIVPLTSLTKRILRESADSMPHNARVFSTSVYGLRQVVNRVCIKADITLCTTHDLRRTFGTLLGELGVSIQVIARCLNHTSGGSITTKVYALHDMFDEKREALNRMSNLLLTQGCLEQDESTSRDD